MNYVHRTGRIALVTVQQNLELNFSNFRITGLVAARRVIVTKAGTEE